MRQFQSEAQKFVDQHGGDVVAIRSLMEYMVSKIQSSPQLSKIAVSGTEEQKMSVVRVGIEHWHDQSQAFFKELLDNKTENAAKWRSIIRHQVELASGDPSAKTSN